MEDTPSGEAVEAAAKQLITDAKDGDLPDFIGDRLAKLEVIISMVGDDEWQLSDEDRSRVLGALVYFCDPEDLIPDHIPGLGFLDDAIYSEIVLDELQTEIRYYLEFCEYRETEEARRAERGEDTKVDREAWLSEKRASLHAKMRSKRGRRDRRGEWRMRLW